MPLTAHSALSKDRSNAKAVDVLQHRHFAVIAGIIATLEMPWAQQDAVIKHFADQLASTNTRFDRKRFIAACVAKQFE